MITNVRRVVRITGMMVTVAACAMLIPMFSALYWKDPDCVRAFLISVAVSLAIGLPAILVGRRSPEYIRSAEGLIAVLSGWILTSLLGALPYIFSGCATFSEALFESVSVLTTSGATAFSSAAHLPKAMLFWRSFSQWLGGAGILLFLMTFIRSLKSGGFSLMRGEAPGLSLFDTDVPINIIARRMYIIYTALSLVEIGLLAAGGTGLFDACIVTFSTCATSGITYYADSLAHFASPYVEGVSAVFMLLASLNLMIFYYIWKRDKDKLRANTEMKAFWAIFGGLSVLVVADLMLSGTYTNLGDALRYGLFHSASFLSTTGLHSTDISNWPTFSKFLLTLSTFFGGCSMSTSGALKIVRVVILVKLIKHSFVSKIHPAAVTSIKINGKPIQSATSDSVIAFLYTYIVLFLAGTFVISFEAADLHSAFMASGALLNNIGAGFGQMGMAGCYADFSAPMKLFMCLLMLAGRLELYAVILPFFPSFWRKDK